MQDEGSLACEICRDLNYHHFIIHYFDNPSAIYYHVIGFEKLEQSTGDGCKLCLVLAKAIAMRWRSISSIPNLGSKGTIWEDDGLALGVQFTENSSVDVKYTNDDKIICKEDIIDDDNSDSVCSKDFENLCIFIRPGKSMLLMRLRKGDGRSFGLLRGIEIYTEQGVPLLHPAFGHSHNVPEKLEQGRLQQILPTWLSECIRSHQSCKEEITLLPKRVIHITESSLRLIETSPLTPGRYATLSHCWGNHPDSIVKLTKQNLEARKADIDWTELNPVYRECILIAKIVKCDYVWIDSLCIIQDDEQDWKEQSLNMSKIYSSSFLNISATSSPDGFVSCFSDRKCFSTFDSSWDYRQFPVTSEKMKLDSSKDSGIRIRPSLEDGHQYITNSILKDRWRVAPLLERAWVLQERLLSPRNLHFTASELIWECRSAISCECGTLDHLSTNLKDKKSTEISQFVPEMLPKILFHNICTNSASVRQIHDNWLLIVESYSTLALSKSTDVSFAIAGIAQHVQRHQDIEYGGGICLSDLCRSLLWLGTPLSSKFASRKSASMPTWLWVSRTVQRSPGKYTCDLSYSDLVSDSFRQDKRFQVHDCKITYDSDEAGPFGLPKSGWLAVTAAVLPAAIKVDHQKVRQGDSHENGWGVRVNTNRDIIDFKLGADCPQWDGGRGWLVDGEKVWCLLVASVGSLDMTQTDHCLVLREIKGQDAFERIGVAHFGVSPHNLFDGAQTRKMVIV